MSRILRFASLLLLAPLSCVSLAESNSGFQVVNTVPFLKRDPSANPPTAPTNLTAHDNGIQYHGGPVISAPQGVNVYLIWYGNWSSDPATQSIVTDFITNLGGSTYFNISATYYDYGAGGVDPVRNRVNLAASITDNYSYGISLTDNDVGNIVQNAVVSGKFPLDQNGVYFVMAAADVDETSGLCTSYCGFHGFQQLTLQSPFPLTQRSPKAVNLIAGFVGGESLCPNLCTWQGAVSGPAPNNDLVADGMVATLGHELMESVTDPFGTGWTNRGQEMADLCDGVTGPLKTLPNGQNYNLTLGARNYLVSEKWVNALGGYCSMSWINGAN
jgi:hypothetical protein